MSLLLTSPELREALVLAIDRELITDKVTQFGELPSYHPGAAGHR